MFEKITSAGEALRNLFGKKEDDEDTRSTAEKIYEVEKAKEEYKPTKEQEEIGKTEDLPGTESIEEILKAESVKKEEEGKEKQLDEKLADIEKVLDKFSEQTPLGTGQSPFRDTVSSLDLNKPIDFQKMMATDYVKPFITQQTTSPKDRIALLYEELKKQGLA